MNASVNSGPSPVDDAGRLSALEAQIEELARVSREQASRLDGFSGIVKNAGQEDKLSMVVFSGSLDRLIAAFIIATGAAAMGMRVTMFFTFWATAALRKDAKVKKNLIERMFGWMLPKGVAELPLSQMNMAGAGPLMIRHVMKKNGVASLEEMITLAAEMDVEINVCSMTMDLLGMKAEEMRDYPGRKFCGVAKFLEAAAPGKITLFI